MKKWLIIILSSIGAIFIIYSLIYSKTHDELYNPYTGQTTASSLCKEHDCDKQKLGYSDYCEDHTCQRAGCAEFKYEDEKYCYDHRMEGIVILDSDLEEASKLAYEYQDTLIAEEKNIRYQGHE